MGQLSTTLPADYHESHPKKVPFILRPRRIILITSHTDISHIVGKDIGLMIRAFAAVLEDDNSLVRRAALDLLLTSLRLDSFAVKNARAEDRTILMRAACSVVLRRDLALNRRLYTWLLGPEEGSENQSLYFRKNALDLLKSTLEVCFTPYAFPSHITDGIKGRNGQSLHRVF